MLTQERLQELLHYCPETGVFTWIHGNGKSVKAGDAAKNVDVNGYPRTKINRVLYKLHKLAFLYMTGLWPTEKTDHINGVRHDNRYVNLRAATNQENMRNAKRYSNNTSGITGVYWHINNRKWWAQINNGIKDTYLGVYEHWFDAVCARKSAEVRYEFHENHGRR